MRPKHSVVYSAAPSSLHTPPERITLSSPGKVAFTLNNVHVVVWAATNLEPTIWWAPSGRRTQLDRITFCFASLANLNTWDGPGHVFCFSNDWRNFHAQRHGREPCPTICHSSGCAINRFSSILDLLVQAMLKKEKIIILSHASGLFYTLFIHSGSRWW